MYPISTIYDKYLRRLDREWLIKADIAGTEYSNSEIVDFEVENSLALNDDFEIGTAILSKLTIRLRTLDEIPPNARIVPYLGLSLAGMAWIDADFAWQDDAYPWTGGATEWLPLGEFYVDSREKKQNVWVYTCYDKLVWADAAYVSSLTYPATMQDVWDEICDSLGYTYDDSVVIDPAYMIQAGPAGYSKRQVLGYIAGANSASIFVGKDGTIKFRRFAAAEPAAFSMTQSDYIRAVQTNPIRTFTRVEVTYNTEDDLTYSSGSGSDNATLSFENPFMTQAMVDDLQATLNGYSYMPLTMDARGFPQIEAGDRVSFARNESQSWVETFVAWEDMDLPWTGERSYETIALHTVYTFRGGLKMSIEAMSKSEQQSEFKVDGTLTTAVNNLNKTTVKEGRSYFGATITRTDGLIVEREDHASKVTLNSDKLAWEVDGLDALYYDALAGKLKYRGDIEMLGGSITWTAVNPPTPSDVGALPSDTTATDIGGVADDDGRLSQLDGTGGYTGGLGQSQVSGLVAALSNIDASGNYTGTLGQDQIDGLLDKLTNINDIGDYIGALSQGQVSGLSTRLTNITSTGVYTGTVGTDQLIAGAALIGTALIEELIVGDNVTMGPSASISWAQVTDQPTIPTVPGYIKSTYIDSTSIISPSISAGTITGAEVRTAASGARAVMSSTSKLFGAYASDTKYIEIQADLSGNPIQSFVDGASSTDLYHSSTAGFYIDGSYDINIQSGGGGIYLKPASGENIYVFSWDQLRNWSGTESIQSLLNGKAALFHTHSQSDISGLSSALAAKADTSYVVSKDVYSAAFDSGTRNLKLFNSSGTVLVTVNIPS